MADRSRRPGDATPAPRAVPERGSFQAELIAVGRDLLRGRVPELNAARLAEALTDRGGAVRRIVVVDDDAQAVAAAVREALERNPALVVVTGGLGPAPDDRTYEGVAEALGRPLTELPAARRQVEEAYRRMAEKRHVSGAGLNLAREKVCRVPVRSEVVPNPVGIAPGAICRLASGTAVVCLPGRPREMLATWEGAVAELGELLPRAEVVRRSIESPTADEAELRPLLESIRAEHPGVWISTHPTGARRRDPRTVITLEATGPTRQEATTRVEAALQRLLYLAH